MNELRWTSDQPTQPGLYWYRGNDDKDAVIVEVCQFDTKLQMIFHDGYGWDDLEDGRWAGPLEAPR